MAKRILNVVETAYRGTLEEQDDPVIWLAHALRGNGQPSDVLLRGSAVNYLVAAQDASGLQFGEKKQTQPPQLHRDVSSLVTKGAKVFFVEDDASNRGLQKDELVGGVTPIREKALAELFGQYDQVWHW